MFPRSSSEEGMSGQKRNVTKLKLVAVLDGHREEITCIKASSEFNVIIRYYKVIIHETQSNFFSGSADRSCIIWDIKRMYFIRSLSPHNGPIRGIDIHKFSV